ncbi:hypothetical protein Vadar_026958 [Vaccinium darrowii]|uniref:Uncharacterized protein n=1 Tax=Vaccinium darrowii TaxID=229202 RepID=A0ACB7YQC8_9ERIC|nr:hypothetical protein Vadar_026958 [Vaccinium darrowii]
MEPISTHKLNPLEPEEFRRQGHMIIDFLADYYKNIEKYPVRSQVEPGYLSTRLPDSAPLDPKPIETIMKDVENHILPGITHWQSPNFFAHFPAGASIAGFMGEMISTGFNVVGFNWVSSPAVTELESMVMDWFGKMLQLPKSFLFSGGGGGVLQGTTWTTSSTAVDPVGPLCNVAKRYNMWVHIDATYAGGALICPEFRHFIDGIEGANSFSLNAHKWFFTNLDCCCLWVKDSNALIKSLSTNPECLRNKATESNQVVDYKDWQIQLSRRFRTMKLWLVFRSYGVVNL